MMMDNHELVDCEVQVDHFFKHTFYFSCFTSSPILLFQKVCMGDGVGDIHFNFSIGAILEKERAVAQYLGGCSDRAQYIEAQNMGIEYCIYINPRS